MLKKPPLLLNSTHFVYLFIYFFEKQLTEKSLFKDVDSWRKLYEISKKRADTVWSLELLGFIKRELNNGPQHLKKVKVNILELGHSVTLEN